MGKVIEIKVGFFQNKIYFSKMVEHNFEHLFKLKFGQAHLASLSMTKISKDLLLLAKKFKFQKVSKRDI